MMRMLSSCASFRIVSPSLSPSVARGQEPLLVRRRLAACLSTCCFCAAMAPSLAARLSCRVRASNGPDDKRGYCSRSGHVCHRGPDVSTLVGFPLWILGFGIHRLVPVFGPFDKPLWILGFGILRLGPVSGALDKPLWILGFGILRLGPVSVPMEGIRS